MPAQQSAREVRRQQFVAQRLRSIERDRKNAEPWLRKRDIGHGGRIRADLAHETNRAKIQPVLPITSRSRQCALKPARSGQQFENTASRLSVAALLALEDRKLAMDPAVKIAGELDRFASKNGQER